MSGQKDGRRHKDQRSRARRFRDFKDAVLARYHRKRIINPVPGFPISYAYGVRNPDYVAGFHTGEDHSTQGQTGKRVIAVSHGKVIYTGSAHPWGSSYGVVVIYRVEDPSGNNRGREYHLGFCHLDHATVKVGERVTPGTVVGMSGNSGNSTGPHCHVECRVFPFTYGHVVNPINAKAILR